MAGSVPQTWASAAKRPLLQTSLEVSYSLNIIENHTPGRVRWWIINHRVAISSKEAR